MERTSSWCGQSRRFGKEYERLCDTSEALIYAAMTRLMLRRLALCRDSHTAPQAAV